MQCAAMNRRTVTMDWDALGEGEDDDRFFEPIGKASSAAPADLASSGSDDDFEDSRTSFVSSMSPSTSFKGGNSSSMMATYDMWMGEPGDIRERRKRLLQGMGLSSTKDMLRLASAKIARAVSRKHDNCDESDSAQAVVEDDSSAETKSSPEVVKDDSSLKRESRTDNPSSSLPSHSGQTSAVLVRSRSCSDVEAFSANTKQRKEELVGVVSKQRLTRTLSGVVAPRVGACQYSSTGRISPKRLKNGLSKPNDDTETDGEFGSFFLIKNLDTGKEFIVKECNEQGMWNKLSDVQTGKQITMEEFEKSVGHSRSVKELMRRKNVASTQDGKKFNHNSYFSKSFINSKKRGAAILKNIKGVASSKNLNLSSKEPEPPPSEEQRDTKTPSQWIKAHHHGKAYKEFTALHIPQEIQAHEGAIWTIKFSSDARLLASAGEDTLIHVWEVQECDVTSARQIDDLSSSSGTAVHPVAGIVSDRPPLAEVTPTPSERKRKGKNNRKKGSMPDYVDVPETAFALSEKPICTLKGHQDEVLDIAWSKSKLLLSSSMDKTVRMWDLETKSCLKMFAHNDYVTCIQFNPVDENYFISGSLDGKIRIWSVPDRQVVDWTDAHEMVTAASYTPDGQGAVIGSHQGICRFYTIDDCKLEHTLDIQMKTKSQGKIIHGFQSQLQVKKITGFQFAPSNPSEVLITSTDSRIRIHNGPELIQKYRGFRNTSSQISACFSPDGKYVISASEDSQVYIWKVAESKNQAGGKGRSKTTVYAHEYFQCKDVTAAITWPGSIRNEPPMVEIISKRHSKRLAAPSPSSPTLEDNVVRASSKRLLPPLPKKNNGLERIDSCRDDESAHSAPMDPGIGASESFRSSSASISNLDSPSISASLSHSWSLSQPLLDNGGGQGGQTVQATAWGMVIVTASLEGEIRIYQNFGLPKKVGRQANLFEISYWLY